MSVRLSNLFEARMKQLTVEWKASRRRRIRASARSRKQKIQPLVDSPGPSYANIDPLKQSDSEDEEPQPSTSARVPPMRLIIPRNFVFNTSRAVTDDSSDEDTNLSTLRNNLIGSGSEEAETRFGNSDDESLSRLIASSRKTSGNPDPSSEDDGVLLASLKTQVNGLRNVDTEDTESSGQDYVLATLRKGLKQNTDANGHSYAKPGPDPLAFNGADDEDDAENEEAVTVEQIENGNAHDDDTDGVISNENSDDAYQPPPMTMRRVNGDAASSASEASEPESDSGSAWSEGGSDSGSDTRPRSSRRQPARNTRSLGNRGVRRKGSPNFEESSLPQRTRRRRKASSESDDSQPLRARGFQKESSDSDDSQPLLSTGLRDASSESSGSSPLLSKRHRRRASESSESPPRRRKRVRTRASDSEEEPPRRGRRPRYDDDGSHSPWRPSDSETRSRPRNLRRRQRRKRSESEDSESVSPPAQVSSRGRVRKMTERAKAAFGR